MENMLSSDFEPLLCWKCGQPAFVGCDGECDDHGVCGNHLTKGCPLTINYFWKMPWGKGFKKRKQNSRKRRILTNAKKQKSFKKRKISCKDAILAVLQSRILGTYTTQGYLYKEMSIFVLIETIFSPNF